MPVRMPAFIDRTGQRFVRWVVLKQGPNEGKFVTWVCQCRCGTVRTVRGSRLAEGRSWSCGCLHKELQRGRLRGNKLRQTHGKSNTREFSVWAQMLQRCENTQHAAYRNYGGRGINVCVRWKHSFGAFLHDMGPCPKGFSLDRINNNKGYNPENCRWASRKAQANNRSSNRLITVNGITKTITEWANDLGTTDATIRGRLKLGWSEKDAVTRPVKKLRKRVKPSTLA